MLTPQQIDEISFHKAKFGGYDMASVDAFLEPLTEDYVTLYKENALLKSKMRTLVEKLEESRKNENGSREALENAKKNADKLIAEAQEKARKASEAIVREAREKAAGILAAAQAAADEAARKAATQAPAQTADDRKYPDSRIDSIQAQLNACIEALEQMRAEACEAERAEAPKAQTAAEIAEEPKHQPSVERPWMKFYPPEVSQMAVPELNLNQFLKLTCRGEHLNVIHYYGTDITWKRFNSLVEKTARAMRAMGLGEGDQIPVLMQATPEYLAILLAAERIGASLLMRDNTIEENAEAIAKSGATIMFTHDYVSQEEVDAYLAAGIEKIVTIDPLNYAIRPEIPKYIMRNLKSRYHGKVNAGNALISWYDFQDEGEEFSGTVDADINPDRPLFRAYTSGSTGKSKQVIHSSRTMLGVICQMTGYGSSDDFRPTWMHTILPPALIAVTVSMLLVPMAGNRLLILNPFVDVQDIDLELMRYKPNTWPLIPMFMEILMRSERIPADYDMSHLLTCGAGAEASNNGQIRRAQQFLESHNCHVQFSTSYGQSEAASNITFPAPGYEFGNGNVGIPMPLNVMGIFRGTRECSYNTLGEICATGPGMMLGYDNEEATSNAPVRHDDGMLWLHTGDTGYVNEDGVFFTLGRGLTKRWNEDPLKQSRLVDIQMENLISDAQIPGVKDCFFVTRPDKEHEGFFVPYMYVVLEEGVEVADVRVRAHDALNPHQYPVEIIQIPERPFYHFKTNRLHMEAPFAR